MILDVSPTRMELQRLKKRLLMARRGHKLLKDKLDELVRQLLALVREVSGLRQRVNAALREAGDYMVLAEDAYFPEALQLALEPQGRALEVDIAVTMLLNIGIPEFVPRPAAAWGRGGFVRTSPALDRSLELYGSVLADLAALSHKEKGIFMIADEIQRTRRRVNALEYILIPNIGDTIRYISMKLDELERNSKAQLMRIKDVVRAPKAPSSAYPGAAGKYPL
ncbi:MAG: V-type ATP synthase subunit D [Spirochaetes bacterium]|nr:V-type ATP synthase subunit D [Spirochaetota bacterium]